MFPSDVRYFVFKKAESKSLISHYRFLRDLQRSSSCRVGTQNERRHGRRPKSDLNRRYYSLAC